MNRERVIGPFRFATRKAAEEAIREILHHSTVKVPLVGSELELIDSLLRCHPHAEEKIGCGVASIDVRQIERGSRQFWITRTDGSRVDFSYKTALDGASSQRSEVTRACRDEVRDQIMAYRRRYFQNNAEPRCPLTDQPLSDTPESHVDHVDPTFTEMVEKFVSILGGWNAVPIYYAKVGCDRSLANPVHRTVWREYHRTSANLRLIHRSANLARVARGDAA